MCLEGGGGGGSHFTRLFAQKESPQKPENHGERGEERSEMRQPLPKNQSVNLGSSETQVYFK